MGTTGKTLRSKEHLLAFEPPWVMGVLNITPDSFHAASRITFDEALSKAEGMLQDGAMILDIGGSSTRPGSEGQTEDEELRRTLPVVSAIHERFPKALLSIDTYHARVAREAVAAGAGMVNDISSGLLDDLMLSTVAELHVPYVMMHMQGTPKTMQRSPHYVDVVEEVVKFLSIRARAAHQAGIADVIVDPGFGFGKTKEHNFALIKGLPALKALGYPVVVGLSRKRMINDVLGTVPAEALNGTTVLNTIALMHGADILRVHDVKEAVEAIQLVRASERPT